MPGRARPSRKIQPLETENVPHPEAYVEKMAADAADLHRSLTAEQAIWLDRLPTHLDLPFLFGAESASVVADRLADAMEAVVR